MRCDRAAAAVAVDDALACNTTRPLMGRATVEVNAGNDLHHPQGDPDQCGPVDVALVELVLITRAVR